MLYKFHKLLTLCHVNIYYADYGEFYIIINVQVTIK